MKSKSKTILLQTPTVYAEVI